jgi:hypothetical protein
MAFNDCNFCGKVGIQPISNKRTTFNYSCLEVKNKKSNKADKADKQRSSKKVKSPIQEELQVKNEMKELGSVNILLVTLQKASRPENTQSE